MKFEQNKSYIGTFYSEELAARIYDIISIKRMGINTKTNFFYNNEQILRIVEANIDFKSPNISEIISELNIYFIKYIIIMIFIINYENNIRIYNK